MNASAIRCCLRIAAVALLAGGQVVAAPAVPTRAVSAESRGGEQAIDVQPFGPESLAAIRHTQRGRPFVLVLWSATCTPCREELPHWGDWQRRYPGVAIVLVATDPPADAPLVRRALAHQTGAPTMTWAFADDYVERLRWSIDPGWYGEVPRTYLYDATHRAVGQSGRLDVDAVERWLLAQSKIQQGAAK